MRNINRLSKSDAMSQTVRSDPSRNKDSRLNIGWAYGVRSHQMNTEERYFFHDKEVEARCCAKLYNATYSPLRHIAYHRRKLYLSTKVMRLSG